ncbi:Predicted kinase, aminoglycoside phosphotransferase (APT) family [Albimonas pacifica]|uniref:Predicted kinase, aminoglycoside phosphotransferase (APT) family n=1 Tax=Albimonas pacifica TaxID=1114924 RepID=A0A1I3E710_9RHOB|nr:Predicted kinase, aminoglycoside phosphotransferase (APT) family [Albimonas pacifica]
MSVTTAPKSSGSPQGDGDTPRTEAPSEIHRFDADALAAWLAPHVPEAGEGLEVAQFQGGMSNPTFLLTGARGTRWVLRKKPPGKLLPKAHAVDREYRAMAAMEGTPVPAPKMIAYCDDPGVIGAEFYVMEHVAGRVIPSAALAPMKPEHRREAAFALVDSLADLHAVDWQAKLEGFGRPGGYLVRQTARWAGQVEASKDVLPPDIDYSDLDWLRGWLETHAPNARDESTVVHGDYRPGNVILHPTEPRLLAILDWELCTIGHPLSDLAYLLRPWRMPADSPDRVDPEADGMPTEAEMIERYRLRSGRERIDDWAIFMAFSMFRLGAIAMGVAARAAQGNVSSAGVDPRAMCDRGRAMAAAGRRVAEEADAAAGG